MEDYARQERIAIRMDSHMTEREAIRLTDSENKPPECVERLQALKAKKMADEAERKSRKARRYNYD